jgi:hypothetical protein
MPVLGERSTRGFKPSKIADNELLFEKEMSGTVKTAEERTWFLVLHTIRRPENGVLILRKFATSTIGKTKRKQRRVSRYLAKLLASSTQQEEKLERRTPVCTPNNNSRTTIVPRVSYQIHERRNPEISGICASHY